jgi:hypothetical protein
VFRLLRACCVVACMTRVSRLLVHCAGDGRHCRSCNVQLGRGRQRRGGRRR